MNYDNSLVGSKTITVLPDPVLGGPNRRLAREDLLSLLKKKLAEQLNTYIDDYRTTPTRNKFNFPYLRSTYFFFARLDSQIKMLLIFSKGPIGFVHVPPSLPFLLLYMYDLFGGKSMKGDTTCSVRTTWDRERQISSAGY